MTATSCMIFVTSLEGSLTFTPLELCSIKAVSTKRGGKTSVPLLCVQENILNVSRLPAALCSQSSQSWVKIFLIASQEHSVPYSLWLLEYDVYWHSA